MSKFLPVILLFGVLAVMQQPTRANQVVQASYLAKGFLVTSEARYSPSLQRLMAEHELKALPILHGRLFYIVPISTRLADEQAQIQYLEYLLRNRIGESKDFAEPN